MENHEKYNYVLEKGTKVIYSCKTKEHIESAKKYIYFLKIQLDELCVDNYELTSNTTLKLTELRFILLKLNEQLK
jgi:hypothetical protein